MYHTTTQDSIERFLFTTVHDLILGVVREKAQGTNISEEQIQFIADFYKYSFVGIMLDWIGKGMNEDYNEIVYNSGQYFAWFYHRKFHFKLYVEAK